jgi:hypothetical protein
MNMFWNKVNYDGLPVTLSKREVFITDLFGFKKATKRFLAYKHGNEWKGLVGYEEYKETTEDLSKHIAKVEKKMDMILDHLNLQYVPETEKKEPAKLEKKLPTFAIHLAGESRTISWNDNFIPSGEGLKPKRKYTKRKKK